MTQETDINADDAPAKDEDTRTFKQKAISEVKFFTGLFAFVLGMMTLVWGHFKIPSESMLPTLEVGDHIYVSKFAYGYSRHSLPFFLYKLPLPDGQIFSRLPKRGDVAVFRNPKNDLVMIKRVVGLPGDLIKVLDGRLYLNGTLIDRAEVDNYTYREHRGNQASVDVYREQLPEEKNSHRIYERVPGPYPLDNTDVFVVPEGNVFFMGDNRDNSTDSRAAEGPGFVPQDHLIGRADLMMFSFKRCDDEPGLRCPPRRFAKGL